MKVMYSTVEKKKKKTVMLLYVILGLWSEAKDSHIYYMSFWEFQDGNECTVESLLLHSTV